MKPSLRSTTRRRRKSLSSSPQVGTPVTASTPFGTLTQDAPRPPCPLGFDPDVWDRVCDIAVAAMVTSDDSGRLHGTPNWATNASFVTQAHKQDNDDVPSPEAKISTPQILKAHHDAALKTQNQNTLSNARDAVVQCAKGNDDETSIDASSLVRFALLRSDNTPRDVHVPAGDETNTGGDQSLMDDENDNRSSERDSALAALKTVRDDYATEVSTLCSTHYENFTSAVAQLEDVREEAVQLGREQRAQNDELQAAGAPLLLAQAASMEKQKAARRLAKKSQVAERCRNACALAADAKHALDCGNFYDVLKAVDLLETKIVPELAPRQNVKSAFADDEDDSEDDDDDSDDNESENDTTNTSSSVARQLASALLSDCARARDAAVRGADSNLTEWLVAARVASAGAGKAVLHAVHTGRPSSVNGDEDTQHRARAFASASRTDVSAAMRLVEESVARAARVGGEAATAAKRAAVDVSAARDLAKKERRAAEMTSETGNAVSDTRVDITDADTSVLTETTTNSNNPPTPLKRRIDFTAEESKAKEKDTEGTLSRNNSSTSTGSTSLRDNQEIYLKTSPFHSLDNCNVFDVPITPLLRAYRLFKSVGLGEQFKTRVQTQRILQLKADTKFHFPDTKNSADDALRRLINVTLVKFVGHFAIELGLIDAAPELFSSDELASTFDKAKSDLEKQVVGALSGCTQAVVGKAALDSLERACSGLCALGFSSAIGLRDCAALVTKTRVMELLMDDTVEACSLGSRGDTDDDSRPSETRSPFATDLASAVEAFAVEAGSFLGGVSRIDEGGGVHALGNSLPSCVAVASRKTRTCVTKLAETCVFPLAKGTNKEKLNESSAATLIADCVWLDSQVLSWLNLAGAAALYASQLSLGHDSHSSKLEKAKRLVPSLAPGTTHVNFAPFLAVTKSAKNILLDLIKTRLEKEIACTNSSDCWSPDHAPIGPSEKASTALAYFYGNVRRAVERLPSEVENSRKQTTSGMRFSIAFTALQLLSDATLHSIERSDTKCVNQHSLEQLEFDLDAFEQLSDTLVETALATERVSENDPIGSSQNDSSLSSLKQKLRRALRSLRVVPSLFQHNEGNNADDIETFIANAFASGDSDDEKNEVFDGSISLTAERVAKLMDKYREVGKKEDADGVKKFAGKKRVEVVAKALRAKAASEKK